MLSRYFNVFLLICLSFFYSTFAEEKEEYHCPCVERYCDHHCSCEVGFPFNVKHCCVRDTETAKACGKKGVWLPEDPVLFHPFIADPRKVTYSVGWRFDDQVIARHVIDVSYGDRVALYRWFDVWPFAESSMQIEVEGALWAVFAPLEEITPLVNADYYVGFPLTYASGRWQFRLRGYHISSHLGDEFMIENPHVERHNPSAEYVDFFVSHNFTDEIRLYAGLGYVVHYDKSFKCRRFFAESGLELRLPQLGFVNCCNQVYGMPFYAMHFRSNGHCNNHIDSTFVLGYEWGKLCGLCRKLRLYAEYHDGASVEGQFAKQHTSYLSIRVGYGY